MTTNDRRIVELTPAQIRQALSAIDLTATHDVTLNALQRRTLDLTAARLRDALHDCPGTGRMAIPGTGRSICPVCHRGPAAVGLPTSSHRPGRVVPRHDAASRDRGDTITP